MFQGVLTLRHEGDVARRRVWAAVQTRRQYRFATGSSLAGKSVMI
jgi:hypothetical protein